VVNKTGEKMKKLKAIFNLLTIAALINISLVGIADADVYQCDNGDCVTTIHTYEGGYNWSILCDGGAHASGSSTGEYGGSCGPAQ